MTQELTSRIVEMLAETMRTSNITVSRNKYDFFVDRLRVAATEPSLLGILNRFAELLNSTISALHDQMITGILQASASQEAAHLMTWLREQPKIAIAIAKIKHEERKPLIENLVKSYTLKSLSASQIKKRKAFDINMKATVTQALSHGADIKAGNNTLFRRGKIKGGMYLPFYSANAIGGAMRDELADHWSINMGFRIDMAEPEFATWFLHFLYSGNIMGEGAIPKAFEQRLCGAAAGTIRSEGIRELRNMFPFFSMMGGVGKSPLEGYIYINDLRPECIEWGNGETPIAELMDWRYIARRDDYEGRVSKKAAKEAETDNANTSMLVNTECLCEGTVLEGGIDVSRHISELEKAALGRGMIALQELGYLGGKKHRGYGRVEIEYSTIPDPKPYDEFLKDHKADILQYVKDIGAEPKGK